MISAFSGDMVHISWLTAVISVLSTFLTANSTAMMHRQKVSMMPQFFDTAFRKSCFALVRFDEEE